MSIFDDNRRFYGWTLALAGAWGGVRGLGDGAGLLLTLGGFAGLAGAGLLLRWRWARPIGVGVILALTASSSARAWLAEEPVAWWRFALLLAGAWAAVDLARSDVTTAEAAARDERAAADRRLEAGRTRARLAHLREHLEAVEEQVRQAHEAEGHLLDFDDCAQDDCAELRARLADTWAKLEGAE